ncbi:MAG TPA: hypothetical protein VFR97_11970 [Capillimicrobium sp.]|nr:hypothetical protein [Capillimicrobium sp.]
MRRSERHQGWVGYQVDDVVGSKIGTCAEVLVDPETDVVWLVVEMGRFTKQTTLVPATEALAGGEHIHLPLQRRWVREAPRALEPEAWRRGSFRSLLYRHYGLVGLPRRRGAGATAG